MWIFLNHAFLSLVDPKDPQDRLLVRARLEGDLERVFPSAKVEATPHRDYRFRALVPRDEVVKVMAAQIQTLSYGNFKASVKERRRHDAYLEVWSVMAEFQRTAH